MWCGHDFRSEETWEGLEDDDSLDDLWKEGGNFIKRGALCHNDIGSHDEFVETLEKWNGKTSWASGTMEARKSFGWATATIWPRACAFPTRGPTRSLRESPNRKAFRKTWHFHSHPTALSRSCCATRVGSWAEAPSHIAAAKSHHESAPPELARGGWWIMFHVPYEHCYWGVVSYFPLFLDTPKCIKKDQYQHTWMKLVSLNWDMLGLILGGALSAFPRNTSLPCGSN
jgi:hypothetical protein